MIKNSKQLLLLPAFYLLLPLFWGILNSTKFAHPAQKRIDMRSMMLEKSIRWIGDIRPRTNTCPAFLTGFSPTTRLLAPWFWECIRPQYEYLLHDFEKVFVHGRILAPCFQEGLRPWTNTCLMFWAGIRQSPTNMFLLSQANTIIWRNRYISRVPAQDEKKLVI